MIYLSLFFEFFKVGLFAVGGGLSTFPFLEEMARRTEWFSISDLVNMIAVSESTPGPIGVNMATFAGVQTAGVLGGITATLGLITPSFIVILIIAKILDKFRNNFYVDSAFYGLKPAVLGLIASAGFSVYKNTLVNLEAFYNKMKFSDIIDIWAVLILVFAFVLIRKFKISPIICIIGSAVFGLVIYGFLT